MKRLCDIWHYVNVGLCIALIVLPIASFFCFGRALAVLPEKKHEGAMVIGLLAPVLSLVFAPILLWLGTKWPQEDDKAPGIWVWYFALIVFVAMFFSTWFLFLIAEVGGGAGVINPFALDLVPVFYYLCSMMCLGFLLLSVSSLAWRVGMDYLYRDDETWRKEPIRGVVAALGFIVLMVYLCYRFDLDEGSIYLFVGTAYVLLIIFEKKFVKRRPNTTYMTFSTDEEGNVADNEYEE
ncbi:MAG: hypothetical protein LBI54_03655 [Lachnospiraceae bacterium]|jgi:hypothetical protein|nr:hypothetical protein [Lachnospiraceae bacterium]